MNRHYIEPNQNSGRFAELAELKEDYSYASFSSYTGDFGNTEAGLCVDVACDGSGDVTGALIDSGDTNTIVVSGTGSGKTRRVLCPYMLTCINASDSFVAHDPKGELYSFFLPLLEKRGYRVAVLDMRDPMCGDRMNPLERAARLWRDGEQDKAKRIVDGIARIFYSAIEQKDDRFWTKASVSLFLCYFTIAATLYEPRCVTLRAIYRIHIEGMGKYPADTGMLIYLDEHKDESCYELGINSIMAPNETRQSIFSVFTSGLSRIILSDDLADMTTASTFDVGDFVSGGKPMALFIITRDESPETCSTLVSTYVDTMYTDLIDLAQTKFNGRLPRTVHFILDEFGNLSKLNNTTSMFTASRSRGLRFIIVLQSLCQLYLIYNKEEAEVLIGNSQNLVFMSSTDMNLVRMISDRCGKIMNPYTGKECDLLSPERLTHLDKRKGETLMLLDRHYPYIAYLPDLTCYKMIEPAEKAAIPKRERQDIRYGLFAEAVRDIKAKKLEDLLNEHKPEVKEHAPEQDMTRKQMLEMPPELKAELEHIISENRR